MAYIFLAEGFEEIEAITVVDVLRRANIEVKIVSIGDMAVKGAHDITLVADCSIEDISITEAKMIILPGGMPGTRNLEKDDKLQSIIKEAIATEKWLAAICAAPMILGNKGYLEGIDVICYPGFEKYLKGASIKDNNVNISKRFITSKGPGTALEFALSIVSVLKGNDLADKLKDEMQYRN